MGGGGWWEEGGGGGRRGEVGGAQEDGKRGMEAPRLQDVCVKVKRKVCPGEPATV